MIKQTILAIIFISACLLAPTSGICQKNKAGKVNLKTKTDSISYVIGINIGKNLKENIERDSVSISNEFLSRGFNDALSGNDSAVLNNAQSMGVMARFQKEMTDKAEKKEAMAAQTNKDAGAKWMGENKLKEGVKQTSSGLQYKIIKAGTGIQPLVTDSVTVNYEGRLINGDIFDSSFDRNRPATFVLGNVIPGWQEGLQLMKEGSVFELYIPSDLGYGDRGYPPEIPGGSTLVFKVELLKVASGSGKN
jgi:FKBP-type peptidyl-prolyl cis-trans isomerase FklB